MSETRTLNLALIQHACPPKADKQANVDKCCALIRDAAAQGAQLIVTQELFASDYFPQTEDETRFDLAEPIPGPTTNRLAQLASELNVEISGSIFEKRAPGLYHNTSVMFDTQGQIVGRYRKMHIPDDPRFYEKYYFTPGDAVSSSRFQVSSPDGGEAADSQLGTWNLQLETASSPWQVIDTRHARTGLLICWDQWFPEAARLTALRGAEVLLYPTAIGWYHGETPDDQRAQKEAWRTIQRSHAIANGVYVAAVNRVGTEGDLTFWGSSFVVDPTGTVIAEASETDEQVLLATCDLSRIEQQRRGWPFLRDRRVDAYAPLTRRLLDEQ
ncbi:MAG: carbon-nitrogen hydrolase [Phycisphaeraceae bacterium]